MEGASSSSSSSAALPSLSSTGCSNSWENHKATVRRVFDEFRNFTEEAQRLYPKPYDDLPVGIVASRKIYEEFSHFLVKEYHSKAKAQQLDKAAAKTGEQRQEEDDFLDVDTVIAYLCCLINIGKNKHAKKGELWVDNFFRCLETGTEENKWLKGLQPLATMPKT